MTNTSSFAPDLHTAPSSRSSKNPIVAARFGASVVLSAVTVALAAMVGLVFGWAGLALVLLPLPLPLVLLWVSSDVLRADERKSFR